MRASKYILWAAWATAALHLLALLVLKKPTVVTWSNILQLVTCLFSVACCALAAKRLSGFARSFWFMVGGSFLLWAGAQGGWLYYEVVLGQVVPTISLINVVFFFFFAPMAVALLWPPDMDREETLWPFTLDVIQLGIVLLTAYLYFFYIGSYWTGREALLNQSIRLSSELRNYFLLAAFLLRSQLTTSKGARRTFQEIAFVLGV